MRCIQRVCVVCLAVCLAFTTWVCCTAAVAEDEPSAVAESIGQESGDFEAQLSEDHIDMHLLTASLIMAGMLILLAVTLVVLLRANRRQRLQAKRLMLLAEISNEFVFEYDLQKKRWNLSPCCARLLKNTCKIIINTSSSISTHLTVAHDVNEDTLVGLIASAETGQEITLLFHDGTSDIFRITTYPLCERHDGKKAGVIGKLENISSSIAEQQRLQDRANRDSMTGLLNTEACKAMIAKRIAALSEEDGGYLLLIDIDNFKGVNDTFGHVTGDTLIGVVANALRTTFRREDILGRVGGDEFCVFLYGRFEEQAIRNKMRNLAQLLDETAGIDAKLSLSVGAAHVRKSVQFLTLYTAADHALYEAKRSGKACCCFAAEDEALL